MMSLHSLSRRIYYRLSPRGRLLLRRIYYLPADLFRRRDAMIPPRGMIFVGSGDFVRQGLQQRDTIIRCTDLKPNATMLDVGSGIGRLAVVMTGYLTAEGSFEGFDVVKKGVDWCQKHITRRYPNFVFTHIDLKNDLYNLSTETAARDFVFPYTHDRFDVVTLFSVFSHMIPDDIDHYLSEIRRVLKPGGRCVATFFILDDVALKHIAEGRTGEFNFPYRRAGYAYLDEKVKEANVAYEKDFLLSMIARNGLLCDALEPGLWSDNTRSTDQFQDLVVLRKP